MTINFSVSFLYWNRLAHIQQIDGVLTLIQGVGKAQRRAFINFTQGRYLAGKVGPLIKTMGGPNKRVLDMTAGWGKDAHHLACNGYYVTALEQHCALVLMLAHARASIEIKEIKERIQFKYKDARTDLNDILSSFAVKFGPIDVAYIDPMFPPKGKSSAAVKKDVALLKSLVEEYTPENDRLLLMQVLKTGAKRVVVKRPLRVAPIMGPAPSGCIKGKLIRFDIYSTN